MEVIFMKYFARLALLLLVSSPLGCIYADMPIVCPDVNQIQVDIMSGLASAPDGWSGQSAIPLKLKDHWRSTVTDIDAINYGNPSIKAECQYSSTNVSMIIDIFKTTMPENYQLYDVTYGIEPLGNCWVPRSQINSGPDKECYWYANAIAHK